MTDKQASEFCARKRLPFSSLFQFMLKFSPPLETSIEHSYLNLGHEMGIQYHYSWVVSFFHFKQTIELIKKGRALPFNSSTPKFPEKSIECIEFSTYFWVHKGEACICPCSDTSLPANSLPQKRSHIFTPGTSIPVQKRSQYKLAPGLKRSQANLLPHKLAPAQKRSWTKTLPGKGQSCP